MWILASRYICFYIYILMKIQLYSTKINMKIHFKIYKVSRYSTVID